MQLSFIFQNLDTFIVGAVVTISVLLGFVVYFSNKKGLSNRSFLVFSIVSACWSILNYVVYQMSDSDATLIVTRLVMFFAVLQAFTFYTFIKSFPDNSLNISKKRLSVYSLVALFGAGLTLTPFVFDHIEFYTGDRVPHPVAAWGIVIFGLISIFFLLAGIVELLKKYKRNLENRHRFKYILIGVFLTFLLIVTFNFIFPSFLNDSSYIPMAALFLFPFFLFTSYSIIKYKLFNTRIISAEIVVFLVIITSLFETLLSTSMAERIFRGTIFVILLSFGILLIRNVLREIEQKEKIQELASSLADTNSDLEEANEKLKALDRQKTEFVSLASHQLRSPLTAIKGYSSMMLEGSFGRINAKALDAVGRIFESSQKLVLVIEDFLNVTRIELGRMKYDLTAFDLGKIADSVLQELKPNIEKRGLKFTYKNDKKDHTVFGDFGKISQVIGNLIDNSTKYTKEGSITVSIATITDKQGKSKVRFSVSDTGVGIGPETMPHLFEKFVRAYDAAKTNIIGTGLGLFVAKQIIDAHQGRIWAESKGKGLGSTFIVELDSYSKDQSQPLWAAALSMPMPANGQPNPATEISLPVTAPSASAIEPETAPNPTTVAAVAVDSATIQ